MRNLPALLALCLLAGGVTAVGARFAAENARLGARIRRFESRPVSGKGAASSPLPEPRQPATRRPDPQTPPSPYATAGGLLKLLGEGGIEVVSYSLEAEKERLTLSGSAQPEALISFFGSLPGEFPGISFPEFEIARNVGEPWLLFSFSVDLGKHVKPVSPGSPSKENEGKVLALFAPGPPTLPSGGPKENPLGPQPAGASLSGRYIGSAVIDGNLRLYLMDETTMHLTSVTPATKCAEGLTERIETEPVEKMINGDQIQFNDFCSFDPLPAASDRLRQPRP